MKYMPLSVSQLFSFDSVTVIFWNGGKFLSLVILLGEIWRSSQPCSVPYKIDNLLLSLVPCQGNIGQLFLFSFPKIALLFVYS